MWLCQTTKSKIPLPPPPQLPPPAPSVISPSWIFFSVLIKISNGLIYVFICLLSVPHQNWNSWWQGSYSPAGSPVPCTLFSKYVLNEFHGCQGGVGFEKVVSNCKQAHFKILFPEVHFFILKIKINKSVHSGSAHLLHACHDQPLCRVSTQTLSFPHGAHSGERITTGLTNAMTVTEKKYRRWCICGVYCFPTAGFIHSFIQSFICQMRAPTM